MRHKVRNKRFGRSTSLRKATVNSLAKAIVISQSIRTTYAKAKAAVPSIERLITLAKRGTLVAKREVFKVLLDHDLVNKLFGEIAALFKDKESGFTRILKLNKRRGDGAQIVILELTRKTMKEKKVKKEKASTQIKEEQPIKSEEEKAYPAQEEMQKQKDKKKEPSKKFLGGLRGFFKKERDSLYRIL